MRIAQVTPVYPPYRGGIGAVAAEYARRLAGTAEVVVFTPAYGKKVVVTNEAQVVRLRPWYAWGNAALVPTLFLKLRKYNVIHLHYPFYGGEVFAWLASVIWRIPLVVTYHMRPKAKGWLGGIFHWHRVLIEPFILRQAKKVLVSSREYAKENIFSFENEFSNENRFSFMPFGVDMERFFPGRDDAWRQAHGISLESGVVLFVGGLDDAHYFKGLSVLLEACAALSAKTWTLVVVGSGNRLETYQKEAEELGIAPRVRFVGSVPFDDLPRAYRAADIHVLPSIDRSEAFGIVTIEAAASGIPSVVSDLPGVRSVVAPNVTGLVVPVGDVKVLARKLDELLQHDGRIEMMGAAARVRAEEAYDAKVLAEKLMELYRSIV